MTCLRTTVAALTLLSCGTAANAATILFANMTNSQENPPVIPTTVAGVPRPSSGFAQFVLNDAMTSMTFTATVFGLDFTGSQSADINDNLTAAHIHAGPAVTLLTNGPVVFGFFGAPFNDNNPNDVVVAPFAAGVGGVISGKWDAPEGNNTTLTAQLSNILGGRAYINFHTTQFPGGELRGAMNVIPEPSSILLFGVGLSTLAVFRLRRRNPGGSRRT